MVFSKSLTFGSDDRQWLLNVSDGGRGRKYGKGAKGGKRGEGGGGKEGRKE